MEREIHNYYCMDCGKRVRSIEEEWEMDFYVVFEKQDREYKRFVCKDCYNEKVEMDMDTLLEEEGFYTPKLVSNPDLTKVLVPVYGNVLDEMRKVIIKGFVECTKHLPNVEEVFNKVIFGQPGVGKTEAIKDAFRKLHENESTHTDGKKIDCPKYYTDNCGYMHQIDPAVFEKIVVGAEPEKIDPVTDMVLNWDFQRYEPEDEVVLGYATRMNRAESDEWRYDQAWRNFLDRKKHEVWEKAHPQCACMVKLTCPRKYKDLKWVLNWILKARTLPLPAHLANSFKGYRLLPFNDLITGEVNRNMLDFEQEVREALRENHEGSDEVKYELFPFSNTD